MKRWKIIVYWIATVWLGLGMVATGIAQLGGQKLGPGAVDSMVHMGYPMYLLKILALWKLAGVAALLAPRMPLVKEWAYAGFVFLTTGAIVSHVAVGDPVVEAMPALLLLVLTAISWWLRPEGRRIAKVNE